MDTKTAWNCYDITDIPRNCYDNFPYIEYNCKELLDSTIRSSHSDVEKKPNLHQLLNLLKIKNHKFQQINSSNQNKVNI